MEEEYFLYNNTLYSKGDLSKKYGESVDQKINEFGFEKAYQYNDVVYSSSQLKSKYGDDYESVIETKGITPYGVKKKEQTQQPQEEDITEDSSTVAEPLQESGGDGRQDRGLENPMALYGKYTANKFELDQALKKKAQFEDADFLTQAIISKDIDKNNERILEITANQTIYTDKLLQPVKEEFKNLAYGEDGKVKSDFVATNYYGINNPDLDKIKEYADEKITDENLRRVFIKNTQATLQASLDNFDEIYNKNLDIAFEEQSTPTPFIGRDNYITPVKSVKSVLEEKAKKAYVEKYVPLLQERITASNSSIDSLKAEVEPMVINQINALQTAAEKANEEYIAETQTILNTPAYTPEEVKSANVKLESLYKNHVQKVGDYITKSQEIENNYNSRLNRHAAKLEREYQEYASAINQKFNEEYKLDPETKKALDAASKIAAERTQNQININKKIDIQKGDVMGFNPMGFNPVRVITSFASSLAGMVNDKAVMAGAVDGVTLDKIEQFFQPNVSPIKGFEDLSIYSLQESTGSLMGSMMPSIISGLATAAVTKNFSTTAKVITAGMSQFLTVSYDNMASTYREVYDETGSVEKATDAAKEVWKGELKIAPVYVLTGLKFTNALSKLGTPARVVAGGAIELVGETTEETFESAIQAQVSETGSQEGFTSQITPQLIEENFLNVLPTGVMGMFGTGGSPTNKIYKAPDLAVQHLYNVIERDGKGAANLEIATLYNRGKISEDVFKKLSNYIDNHEFANSKSYNAIMAKKDMVAESIELEKDPVKKKILKEQVKAYEELMERTLLGEEGLTSEVEVDGEKYIDITNNPIKLIRLLNEKEKIGSKEGKAPAEKQVEGQATTEAKKTEKTTVEQKDDIERRRQEELEAVNLAIAKSNETGEAPTVNGQLVNKNTIKEINDKYNEELAGLEQRTTVEQYGDKKEVAIDEELSEDELESLAKDLETFEEELPRDVTEEVKKEVEENRQKNLSESMPKAKALEGANVTIFDKKAKIIYVKEDGKGGYVVKLKDDKGLVRRIKGSDAEVLINNLATLADETISPQATKAQSVEENRRQKQREAKAKQKEAKAKQLAEQKKVKNKEKADRVKAREQKIKERNKQSLSEFREKQKQEKSEEKEIRDYNKSVEDEFKNEVREEERFLKEYEKELKEELDRKLKAEEARIVEFEGESYYVEKVEKNKYKIIGGNGRAVQGNRRSAISAVYDTEVGKIEKAETKAAEEKLLNEMMASEDRVEAALQKAIDFFDLSQNKAYKNSAMSTIGVVEIPAWAIKSTLQIVKMTYKATKNLAEAISAGYAYISTNHPEVKENDFSKFIVNELKKQLPSKSQQPSSGAKKPQQKQSTAKTATAGQKSKQQESEGKEDSIISKGVTVEGAPEGIYIDVEMIAGKDGRKLTPEEVLDAIPIDGIEFDNDGNNLMIKLPRELTSSEMMSLMKATEQEAIGQLSNGTGKLYAQSKKLLEDYGNEFNEKFFKTPRKEKLKKYEKSTAGNRIFNKPLEAVKKIANNYYERVFGKKRPIFKGITKIDKEFAKRIANAYEAMQNNPNDPEVRAAYKALARETMEQYKEFDKAGFIIEINNKEPYNNSQEMIDDLRENRRIKIFSTESGFGDTPITDKQRKENPLLRDSGKKDANGNPLLINDIFRAIHDFYGHAELGNGFGAIGEENAWNVHARMYSPLARRAMTTETRGQNSWVNFSGINDEAFKKIDRARELRRQGKKAEAQEIVSQIYEMMSFAEQKVGLLPREFSELSLEEGTATAGKKSKQTPQDVKKETEGLTEKEVAKQGVEEIVQAYKNKLKEAKQKANEKISDEKQKARILKGNIKAAKDIITGIIEESIPKGVMLGKSILRDVANALTPKQIERVADRIERNVENIQRRNKINDIKSKQAKVKKKLPNFTNQQESVKEILNVDLTQVKDLGILQEIENELDAALERDVAKLDPKRMSELLDKLEQKSQPESKTTSKRKVSEKIQSLKESDKNSDKKIKELQSLNRALDKTLGLNQINQDDYNDALSIIEKELELLEKDRQEDTNKLNKDSVERLSKLDEKPFSKVQKDEIKRLKNVAGKSTKYRDALKLNEIIDELELGYIPVKQMDEYRNDAISYQESNNLSTQINKRTGLDSIKNKLASLLGLQREGTLRGSKKNKSFSDALNILELNNISSWNDLFGLGRKEGISNFLSPLFTNMIATTSENVRHIMNNYFTIKYPISPFKKGLTKDKEIALIMMRKQGDWEVTEGMDTDYWGELLSEKNIEEAKKQYNGDKSDISLKKIIKIYESLPKRKGKLDYEGYFENLKGVEKRMNYFLTKLAEDNAPLQEIANQRNGKEFVKRDSRYYLTDIVLRDSGGALEDGLGGLSFVLSNGVSLDAGVGETRTSGKKVKPILLDLDRIVNKQTTETIRDYNLSSNLKAIRKTFIRTIPQLTEPNARALMSMFGQALSIRMQAEYGIRAADSSRNFIGKLLGAARAYFLAGFKRVGVEFVAEVFRSLPATRKRYVPNAVKAIIQARAMGIKLHKELLARTGSPYLKKAYLESSAADSQVTADTKRTIFGRISDFVKGGSDGMMGVSSNVVFPQVWLPEFLYQFKQLTGKDFDVKNYSDAYFNKNEKDIRSAAIIADTNAERIFGGSTRAARRTKAKWLGTPVIGLIQSIQGKFTGDYSFGNKYKYVDPYTNFGMLNTFLSNFAGIEAYNTFTRGLKGIFYGENVSRWKAGQYLLFGIISGTLYTYLRDEIMTILFGKGEDEEDERETEEKFIDAMINNIIFLSVGQYGQSAQLALRTFVGIYEDRLDDEQKKRFRRLSQDRFNVYPLNFGYGSITRAYDNLIPFLGETISTISQSKDVIMNAKEIEDGITLSEEEMMTLKAIELTNNMLKLAFTVKGTQIPMQRDIDRVLKALDKIESGKEITRSEYELLETYNFIPIIDEIYENADIKE